MSAEATTAAERVVQARDNIRIALHNGGFYEAWKLPSLASAIDALVKASQAEALAPREPSPELAEAEAWLRRLIGNIVTSKRVNPSAILAELDRLRSEVARLTGEAQLRSEPACEPPKPAADLSGVSMSNYHGQCWSCCGTGTVQVFSGVDIGIVMQPCAKCNGFGWIP